MKHKALYYKDFYLGTLFENGIFDYMINSNHAHYMDIEMVVHNLERLRLTAKQEDFNFDEYIATHENSTFKDGFEFR